jgi:uncharacterized protein (TIGR02996 family)
MANEEAALIAAIRAARDDDLPRLVYADWLDEHGQPDRAEFIRLQCWLSAHPMSHPEWEPVWEREQQLLQEHNERWWTPFRGYVHYDPGQYDRGFPTWFHAGRIDLEYTLVVSEMMGMVATDRLACFGLLDRDVNHLVCWPDLSLIRELRTNDEHQAGMSLNTFQTLIECEYAQRLIRLDLTGAGHMGGGSPEAELLARLPVLPELEHVHLASGWPPDVRRVIDLLESPHRSRLRGLAVWGLSDDDVEVLCGCPALAKLTHLDFGNGGLGDDGAVAVAECPYLDGIRLLSVGGIEEDISPAFQSQLRERFGERVWIDPNVYIGSPTRWQFERLVVTGRRI